MAVLFKVIRVSALSCTAHSTCSQLNKWGGGRGEEEEGVEEEADDDEEEEEEEEDEDDEEEDKERNSLSTPSIAFSVEISGG